MRRLPILGLLLALFTLSTTSAQPSPGPIWNIQAKGASSEFMKATSGISTNMLLGASAAFRMFAEIERRDLGTSIKAGMDSIGFVSLAKGGVITASKFGSDIQAADSVLKQVDFAVVEMSLRIPKEGLARDDWNELVTIAKSEKTAGVLKQAQKSADTLSAHTEALVRSIQQRNQPPEHSQLLGAIVAWNREIQKGIYVSSFYSQR